ncbi:hypothetical protein BDZ90DRAFT_230251 [Jaminaea rosea]|uniref:Uncharacterized protein n=1 Tax=Jaminaea rosea TaxID=1569628 RepID=A0A316UWM3_9BASI|nr:hypothetical protein BDZ90DRAFT_230251 [Jaminaea rosea]PWN29374.1 hypothetical protein BDZ90DRAFT_230251 [Jaminaea rosea]
MTSGRRPTISATSVTDGGSSTTRRRRSQTLFPPYSLTTRSVLTTLRQLLIISTTLLFVLHTAHAAPIHMSTAVSVPQPGGPVNPMTCSNSASLGCSSQSTAPFNSPERLAFEAANPIFAKSKPPNARTISSASPSAATTASTMVNRTSADDDEERQTLDAVIEWVLQALLDHLDETEEHDLAGERLKTPKATVNDTDVKLGKGVQERRDAYGRPLATLRQPDHVGGSSMEAEQQQQQQQQRFPSPPLSSFETSALKSGMTLHPDIVDTVPTLTPRTSQCRREGGDSPLQADGTRDERDTVPPGSNAFERFWNKILFDG